MIHHNNNDKGNLLVVGSVDKMEMVVGESTEQNGSLDQEQLQVLFRKEAVYQISDVPCCAVPHERICTEDWRQKICSWSYKVVDTFRLDRSIVATSMKLLDRFMLLLDNNNSSANGSSSSLPSSCPCMSCKRSLDSSQFQLASMATLCIAIKISPEADSEGELERRKHFQVTTMVDFSRGLFSQQDIARMEGKVLSTLSWEVNPPTATLFIPYLLGLLPPVEALPLVTRQCYPVAHKFLTEVSRYLCELAVSLGKDFNDALPSEVAFSSLLVAVKLLTVHALPEDTRVQFCNAFYQQLPSKPRHERIGILVSKLLAVLWPEMLLEHSQCNDPTHPISMALHYGLVDLSCIQKQPCHVDSGASTASPPQSPMVSYGTPYPATYDSPVSAINSYV
mmetsp:Transcript_11462/g.25551  ORF Transcript_11462/g.25551 Transcript_11462/m.25551 type:complete len:393 (-) Transcript_11462:229-1407(-)